MSSQTYFVFIFFVHVVHSELLFEQGYIKFRKHGGRLPYNNVEHIDDNLIEDKKPVIIVKTKRMEILRSQAVRNLKNLERLALTNCGIRKIESEAFFNLPNLSILNLQDNLIGEVKKGIFNGLQVKILVLQRNEIKNIDSEAFDNMPNLYKIKMNSNRLKSWDSNWFKNTPKLTEVYFRRNKINYLPPSAFVNIKVKDAKIFLSKNKLGGINPESFYDLDILSQLYLDRNNIQQVPEEAFRDLKEIDVIYLARNKISEIKSGAFPKVRKIGILDLSSNLLECLPYNLVTLANVTNLEKNNATCDCIKEFQVKLKEEKRNSEITYIKEDCPDT